MDVAGVRIRVAFAGAAVADGLMPPLERLASAPSEPVSARFYMWDSESSGTPAPQLPPPWAPDDAALNGGRPRYRTVYSLAGDRPGSISVFDTEARIGHVWVRSLSDVRWHERLAPLRTPLHWALASPDRFLAHGSAVGHRGRAVLLTGRGGAGKTTTTLACVDAGLDFVGDNYLLLDLAGAVPRVYGLYGGARFWPGTLERLPHYKPLATRAAPEEKLSIEVARHRPGRLATGLPVSAVVVPRVIGAGPTTIAPCSPVEALLGLAPASVINLPRTDNGFSGMSRLVRSVPTFQLTLGAAVNDSPPVLRELIEQLAAPG
jgi:hypothetical protein